VKSRSIKLQPAFKENGEWNIHVGRKTANRIGRTAGYDRYQGTSSGIWQDPYSEGKRPVGVQQKKCECLYCHNREADCGPSRRDAVCIWVTPDVSEKPVRRGSPTHAASDPRVSKSRRRNVYLMSYLFWITRRCYIVAMIRNWGISFRSQPNILQRVVREMYTKQDQTSTGLKSHLRNAAHNTIFSFV